MNLMRLFVVTVIIATILFGLTALSIYIVYDIVYGNVVITEWPWVRYSIVMAILTCLWTYSYWFGAIVGRDVEESTRYYPLSFGIGLVPVDAILMYPGMKELEINRDTDFYLLIFVLMIIHGIGFYFIQRQIRKCLNDQTEKMQWFGWRE